MFERQHVRHACLRPQRCNTNPTALRHTCERAVDACALTAPSSYDSLRQGLHRGLCGRAATGQRSSDAKGSCLGVGRRETCVCVAQVGEVV